MPLTIGATVVLIQSLVPAFFLLLAIMAFISNEIAMSSENLPDSIFGLPVIISDKSQPVANLKFGSFFPGETVTIKETGLWVGLIDTNDNELFVPDYKRMQITGQFLVIEPSKITPIDPVVFLATSDWGIIAGCCIYENENRLTTINFKEAKEVKNNDAPIIWLNQLKIDLLDAKIKVTIK